MKKCNFTEEPDGYLRDANVTKAESYISDFNYTCNNTGFNYTNDQPPFEADQECIDTSELNDNPYQEAYECQGEVWHANFWTTRQIIEWFDPADGTVYF